MWSASDCIFYEWILLEWFMTSRFPSKTSLPEKPQSTPDSRLTESLCLQTLNLGVRPDFFGEYPSHNTPVSTSRHLAIDDHNNYAEVTESIERVGRRASRLQYQTSTRRWLRSERRGKPKKRRSSQRRFFIKEPHEEEWNRERGNISAMVPPTTRLQSGILKQEYSAGW